MYYEKRNGVNNMSLLEVDDMTHGFGDKILFHHVSFRLQAGEHIGLVGANGQGKTTFMKLITHELLPDDGNIVWGNKIQVGYMDQNVELVHYDTVREVLYSAFLWLYELEVKMNELYEQIAHQSYEQLERVLEQAARIQETLEKHEFYSIKSRVEGVSTGLGIYDLLERNPEELSGGQRTKVILAKLLLEQPDVLLLDEPTNHLDEENIDWLRQYLINYKKAFLIISHDIQFINAVINVVYYLKNHRLTRYPGNYEQFLHLFQEKEDALIHQYMKQQVTIKKLETYIQKNKVRTATAAQAKSREKQLNKIERIELDKKLPTPHFDFSYVGDPTRKILVTKDLVIGYDDPLTKPLNLTVSRGDKIVFTGANGIGKTTLMKSLLALLPAISGSVEFGENVEVGYYEQELIEVPDTLVINYAWDHFPYKVNQEIRAMLARCGLRTEHILNEFASLSGGEQSRARLCTILYKKTNVLFLDEPTNHLDQEAKNELKRALIEYPGTVIFVSHEKEFYEEVATQTWDCREFQV